MEYSTLQPWQEIGETGIVHDAGSLYGRFHQVADPRGARGKQYSLVMLLVVIFLAKLAGKDKPDEIADWAKNHAGDVARLLGLEQSKMPSHSTIRRVFSCILDEAEFDRLAEEYHQQEGNKDEMLAMDGKALRGTRIAGQERSDHVLSLYAVESCRVLAQQAVDSKENEIVVAPRVLESTSLVGKIVTGDAMHTQRAASHQIVTGGGDYLWPVKENQGRLYEDIQHFFAPDTPKRGFGKITTDFLSAHQINYGHGRFEKRNIQTSTMLNDYLDWPGIGQVYRLEREFSWVRQGNIYKTSREIEFGITSLSREKAPPAKVLACRRSHWRIETSLHYRRDVTFREDATRMTIGAAGRILATVHNLVIGLIKRAGFDNAAKARRYYEGHLSEAFRLLITSNCHS
ncbi:MAG: ISAs1 family transposase [Chloroflexi bacterium]|nr:ISAs1 family transposase [Chloroflexota bacterium]MBM3153119.1 ISAs1 family transposase [Chloroflexota bacterium]